MPIQILGSGLARTGTMSLKHALEVLTGEPCYHMIELLKNSSRLSILKAGYKSGVTDWPAFFKDYHSSVDYPACLYLPELLALNPGLKVIHTRRDPETWYDSVRDTVYRGVPQGPKDIIRLIKNSILHKEFRQRAPVFMFNEKIIWKGQFQSRFSDKHFAIDVFLEHERRVQDLVPKGQLLMYEIKEGWAPLCEFLAREIPLQDFSRANQKDEFNAKMDQLFVHGKFVE